MAPFAWHLVRITVMSTLDPTDFWAPTFDIVTRDDGTIIMQQTAALPDHMPTLADYLDKWADATLLAKIIAESKKAAPIVSLATLKER